MQCFDKSIVLRGKTWTGRAERLAHKAGEVGPGWYAQLEAQGPGPITEKLRTWICSAHNSGSSAAAPALTRHVQGGAAPIFLCAQGATTWRLEWVQSFVDPAI